jgi:phosphoribosylanthranilate isomerase
VDAEFSVKAGVDALGFNGFPPSPRYVLPGKVRDILNTFDHSSVGKVGIFVDSELDMICQYVDAGIDTIQLHGNESSGFAEKCAEFAKVWKVIKPQSEEDIKPFIDFPADKFLIDAFHKDLHGGTGLVLEPEIAKFAVEYLKAPVILAGGISPENCLEIAESVRPFGLDVNSGVEISPGIKDHDKIEKLINNLDLK